MRAARFLLCVLCLVPVPVVAHPVHFRIRALSANAALPPSPPRAPVRPVTDVYYGTKVVDPYRYMENLDDPEVQTWFKAQNAYARETLASIPGREKLLKRIEELDATTGAVGRVLRLPGDVYLYTKVLGGDDTPKLYIRKGLTGEEKLLLDPERIEVAEANRQKGGKLIGYFAPSDDLKYVAVTITPGGSELDTEIHVLETQSGRDIGEVIPHCCVHGNPMWLPDNRSFLYGRWQTLAPGAPLTETRQKYRAYLHVLGSDPGKDQAVFGFGVVPSINVDPVPKAFIRTQPGSKYVLGVLGTLATNAFYIAPVSDIGKTNPAWRKVADFSDQVKDVVIHGDDLYLLTSKNAPRYKIVRLDARNPDLANAFEVVPPGEGVITAIATAQDALYVQVLDGGTGRLLRIPYDADTQRAGIPRRLELRGDATLLDSDPRLPGTLVLLGSWTSAYKTVEFGSTKTQGGFKALYAMSPLQHVKQGMPYPAVLLTTGINEPRVNPWQPGKLAAHLQAATTSGKPVLLYVDYGGGHGSSTAREEDEQLANSWSFLLWQFGDSEFQPH